MNHQRKWDTFGTKPYLAILPPCFVYLGLDHRLPQRNREIRGRVYHVQVGEVVHMGVRGNHGEKDIPTVVLDRWPGKGSDDRLYHAVGTLGGTQTMIATNFEGPCRATPVPPHRLQGSHQYDQNMLSHEALEGST